jgi:hypothetical protein
LPSLAKASRSRTETEKSLNGGKYPVTRSAARPGTGSARVAKAATTKALSHRTCLEGDIELAKDGCKSIAALATQRDRCRFAALVSIYTDSIGHYLCRFTDMVTIANLLNWGGQIS